MSSYIIAGSGSYIPERVVPNSYFEDKIFFDENSQKITKPGSEIVKKFAEITEIIERRYLEEDLVTSDIASISGKIAIENSGICKEDLDYVIVAHNSGDISYKDRQPKIMPSVSSYTKHKIGILNPYCIPYDMNFGCPGWLEGVILAYKLQKNDQANNILVVGADALSRSSDPFDRNCMIFADGAGAVVLSRIKEKNKGILHTITHCDNGPEINFFNSGKSLNPDNHSSVTNIRMKGRKVYEYALKNVPIVMKKLVDEAGYSIFDINKVLIHQANAKMDHAMLERFFKLYELGVEDIPVGIAPMTIQNLGNTSVATLPTMYDLIVKGKFKNQELKSGDLVIFASIGASMNINAMLYRMP